MSMHSFSREPSERPENHEAGGEPSKIAQFLVFKDLDIVGREFFMADQVTIGQGPQADLVLSGPEIAPVHAIVYFKGEQIIISDQTSSRLLLVNGMVEKTALLGPLDLIEIGPYSLQIKVAPNAGYRAVQSRAKSRPTLLKGPQPLAKPGIDPAPSVHPPTAPPTPSATVPAAAGPAAQPPLRLKPETRFYNLIFEGKIKSGYAISDVKQHLAALFRSTEWQMTRLFSSRRVVFKRNVGYYTALGLKTAFEKSGALCRIEPAQEGKPVEPKKDLQPSLGDFAYLESPGPFASQGRSDRESAGLSGGPGQTASSEDLSSEDLSVEDLFPAGDLPDTASRPAPIEAILKPSAAALEAKLKPNAAPVEVKIDPRAEEVKAQIEPQAEPIEANRRAQADAVSKARIPAQDDDADEDEADEDDAANFLLKDKMVASAAAQAPSVQSTSASASDKQIEVIKCLNQSVIDVRYLGRKQKYFITLAGKRFCLAHNKRPGRYLYYFNNQFRGTVGGSENGHRNIEALKTAANIYRKRKCIYRDHIPEVGQLQVSDGCFDYFLSLTIPTPSPAVEMPSKRKIDSWKHLLTSIFSHAVFLAFLGLIPWTSVNQQPEVEPRFVQIDPRIMQELEKPPPPPPVAMALPEIKPPETPEPPKPVEKPKPKRPQKPKAVKKPPKQPAAKAPAKPKVAQKTEVASRHPDAGGGSGQGNVINRDVKQTGLLSLIGDSVGIKPQTAIAAVTNLDAVPSPGASQGNFTVGGVVGKLGQEKIVVPSGAVLATKGSNQVLRSAGAGGPGRVAALEKGQTGLKQVVGMVTADHLESVNVQGGMSREAVKRVIDQHLDEITYCYETALISNPAIMGRMIFEWKIMMSGDVGEIQIKSSTINSHDIHDCIKSAIKGWKFPRPVGTEVLVSYPFIFDIVGF